MTPQQTAALIERIRQAVHHARELHSEGWAMRVSAAEGDIILAALQALAPPQEPGESTEGCSTRCESPWTEESR